MGMMHHFVSSPTHIGEAVHVSKSLAFLSMDDKTDREDAHATTCRRKYVKRTVAKITNMAAPLAVPQMIADCDT